MGKIVLFCAAVFLTIIFYGCSQAVNKESNAGAANEHYLNGMEKLNENDFATAETEFLKAIKLDRKLPMGYTGMAFLELNRKNFNEALKYSKKAINKGRNFVDAYAVRGYILVNRKHGDTWFEESLKPLQRALELDPENERVLFYLAETYCKALEYEKALEYYTKSAEKNGAFAEQANNRIVHVKKIMRTEPLTNHCRLIANNNSINRADLCILLLEDLKLKNFLKRNRPGLFEDVFKEDFTLRNRKAKVKSDVSNNSAKEYILEIIQLHIPFLDLYPDGYFYPDRIVTKALFSEVIQQVMVLVNDDPALSTKFIGIESPFSDVHADYYAFNAINLCIEKRIMENPENGEFNPDSIVSGIDAIIMLKILQDILNE